MENNKKQQIVEIITQTHRTPFEQADVILNLLTIPIVGVPFYCNDESKLKIDKCKTQCTYCLKIDEQCGQ